MTPSAGDSMAEARALLVLDEIPGVGPRTILALVRAFGSGARALAASPSAFARVAGADAARGRRDPAHHAAVERGLELADRLGISVRSWDGPGYPPVLRRLADPPPVLFLRGRVELLDGGGVAVVGSRRCTARGKALAHDLGGALGRAGVPVVSGMALGVDAAAHEGALAGRGPTVAVVGRGADLPYPASHRRLFEALIERGLVVSEFLPGTPPLPHHFPRRNRIMAALAETLVVVEAGARSGALITVEHALDLGRDVWAVPGPIDTPACAGSNQLLAEGALPLVSVDRFVAAYDDADDGADTADVPDGGTRASGSAARRPSRRDGPAGGALSDPERRILRSLDGGPLHVDQLAARAGLDVPMTLAVLVQLELGGVVEQMPGLLFRAA